MLPLLLLATLSSLQGQHALAEGLSTQAGFGGGSLEIQLDSREANLYRQWLLGRSTSLSPLLEQLDRQAVLGALGRHELQSLAEQHSTDLATLLFARSIFSEPENSALQASFESELRRLGERPVPGIALGSRHPTVLFIPGFLYESHPETGGDFAAQRRLLSSLGIPNGLIATSESGSVEENAARIAAALRQRRNERVILVSASKGGPEVALALGKLLAPEETHTIALWINIGGLLGGSPIADGALRPSRAWFVRLVLWWKNLDIDGIRSLRTSESRQRMSSLRLPFELPVINLVPVTLSGTVSKQAEGGYRKLREIGPNDGLALLSDQVFPGSQTLLLIGDDHFLTRQDPRALTLALLHIAGRLMDDQQPRRSFQ